MANTESTGQRESLDSASARRPIGQVLRDWATDHPTRPAVSQDGIQYTYGDLDRLSDRLAADLRERGVTVIDPLPELEKGDNPLQYHFRNDGHWNPRGHRLIGEVLQNALSGDK